MRDLGKKMRDSLPNAFLFGLTGTPINKRDMNTFWAFGAREDKNGYMNRYSFEQSLRDKATLPIYFEPRLVEMKINKKEIDKEFDITFSNNLLNDNESIEDDSHSNVYRSMELYSIFSNMTKKGGYSIHSNGTYISSLYETFFQFLGFKVIDYFRIETGPYKFGIIMKKFNDKKINKEEFDYLYTEFKKRNPIRFR